MSTFLYSYGRAEEKEPDKANPDNVLRPYSGNFQDKPAQYLKKSNSNQYGHKNEKTKHYTLAKKIRDCFGLHNDLPPLSIDPVLFQYFTIYLNSYTRCLRNLDISLVKDNAVIDQIKPEWVTGLVVFKHCFIREHSDRDRREGGDELQRGSQTYS
jgi:hypothetical protein